jgi:hypothetical protein
VFFWLEFGKQRERSAIIKRKKGYTISTFTTGRKRSARIRRRNARCVSLARVGMLMQRPLLYFNYHHTPTFLYINYTNLLFISFCSPFPIGQVFQVNNIWLFKRVMNAIVNNHCYKNENSTSVFLPFKAKKSQKNIYKSDYNKIKIKIKLHV